MNKPQYRIKLVSWDEVSAYFDPNLDPTALSLAFLSINQAQKTMIKPFGIIITKKGG